MENAMKYSVEHSIIIIIIYQHLQTELKYNLLKNILKF